MKEFAHDILFFKNVLPADLTADLNQIVDERYDEIFNRELRPAVFPFEGIRGRVEVYKYPTLFEQFNEFWYSTIEDQMYDHYFQYITQHEQKLEAKRHARTEWKDVFIQVYNDRNTFPLNKNIHVDFSGITFIACIQDGYQGGILDFPKQHISIKLQKGDLILFPGGHTHPHGVSNLTSGERRVLVGQSMGVKQLHQYGKAL